jgi:hypothetical protein
MNDSDQRGSLEEQIDQWRRYVRSRQAIHADDATQLEAQLRQQIAILVDAGLASDEAFLVAVKRISEVDALSGEFARTQWERLWKRRDADPAEPGRQLRMDAVVAFCLAVAAALAIKVPALFGFDFNNANDFYARNATLFVLPLLTGYFVWKRGRYTRTVRWLAAAFVAAVVFANVYPLTPQGHTEILTVLHLPIALWLVVGVAYAGGRWSEVASRMDFIRFSGELFIYYVLIALGGGVFTAFVAMLFKAIRMNPETFLQSWLLPCGAAGAVLIASWLVEAKRSVMENMAPLLTRLFTPLFAAMLITFLGALLWTGRGVGFDRNLLVAFDLLLVVVLGLLVYSVSARDPDATPGVFDMLQVVLVISALVADAVALWAIAARITEFGFTPNRVAALGENVILLVNLAWSAVLYLRFLRGRGAFTRLEQWQTSYVPVYAMWAAIVVIVFPPVFGYR